MTTKIAKPPKGLQALEPGEVDEALAKFATDCYEVRVAIRLGLSRSRQIGGAVAEEFADKQEASAAALSLSKRLFDSKHPAVKAVNAAKGALEAYVSQSTLPLAAVEMAEAQAGKGRQRGTAAKEPGARLILKRHVPEFESEVEALRSNLLNAVALLQDNLEGIKTQDKVRLGKLYSEKDYPEDVTALADVAVSYKAAGPPLDLEAVAPKVFEKERDRVRAKLDATMELAVLGFMSELKAVVTQLGNQLSNRRRLDPPVGHALAKLRGSELIREWRTADDPSVAEGQVRLELREFREEGRKGALPVFTVDVAEAELPGLRIKQTGEKRKVHASGVANLQAKVRKFRELGELFGPYQGRLEEGIAEIEETFRKSGQSEPEKLADEMRKSDYFRSVLATTCDSLSADLAEASQEVVTGSVRRVMVTKPQKATVEEES